MTEHDLRTWAGQVLVIGFPGTDIGPEIRSAIVHGHVGGAILFRRNVQSVEAVPHLIRVLDTCSPPDLPLLLGVDQEGGRVARLGTPVLELPPMRRLGDWNDLDLTRKAARVLGFELRALGFTIDFAPVLDVDSNPRNPIIGDRSFSADPLVVARHGQAFAAGLRDSGLLSCGKHFPGHGDTDLDSHLALPRVTRPLADLERTEFFPFVATKNEMDAWMTAHVVYDALDSKPATLSARIVHEFARDRFGFDGLLISDDLEMKAVADAYPMGEIACGAIEAGCDVLLICSRFDLASEAREGLIRKAEQDSDFRELLRRAAHRFLRVRRSHRPAPCSPTEFGHVFRTLEGASVRDELARRLTAEGRSE